MDWYLLTPTLRRGSSVCSLAWLWCCAFKRQRRRAFPVVSKSFWRRSEREMKSNGLVGRKLRSVRKTASVGLNDDTNAERCASWVVSSSSFPLMVICFLCESRTKSKTNQERRKKNTVHSVSNTTSIQTFCLKKKREC